MTDKEFSYQDAKNYIKSVQRYGSVLGLDTMAELLKRLSNPENNLKFIHVAGTNGKGSVCSYLTKALSMSGYLTGRYISPTIFSYRERIQVYEDTETYYISEKDISRIIWIVKQAADQMCAEGHAHPTPFEIETAAAFVYFSEIKCDYVVLEVGLGGRLDATNVIQTTVCAVLTSVSMDHMQFLGDTLEKIALEKAGIIKKNIPVVSDIQEPEAMKVIKEEALKRNAPLTVADSVDLKEVKYNLEETSFLYKNKVYRIVLLGVNQIRNAALAAEVLSVLQYNGVRLKNSAVQAAFGSTIWHGRFEIISKEPYWIADGAHNEAAAHSLAQSIQFYFLNRNKWKNQEKRDFKIIFIMGVLKDKDYYAILKNTAFLSDYIITFTPENERGLSSETLKEAAGQFCSHVKDAKTIENAVALAKKTAEKKDIVIVFGSLSFLGKLYQLTGSAVAGNAIKSYENRQKGTN